MAEKAFKIAQQRQKAGYDLKVRGATLEVGDRVLVKNLAFDGKHKLADRWEEFAYIVISHPNKDIPVFVVEREDGEGMRRSLHRNHLLLIGYLLPDEQPKPKPRKKPPQPKDRPDSHDMEETQSEIYDFDMFSTADDGFYISLMLLWTEMHLSLKALVTISILMSQKVTLLVLTNTC